MAFFLNWLVTDVHQHPALGAVVWNIAGYQCILAEKQPAQLPVAYHPPILKDL